MPHDPEDDPNRIAGTDPVPPVPNPAVAPYGAPPPAAPARKGLAVAALVTGVAAFLTGWLPVVGAVVGLVAVVLGIVALVRRQSKGLSITGLVLGVVGFFTSVVVSLAALWFAANYDTLEELVEPTTSPGIVEESEPTDPEPTGPGEGGTESPAPADEFATLDAAAFAALVAAPNDHIGENVVLFGEVQQLGMDGACDFLLAVDSAQQSMWEGYTAWALAFALSSEEPGTTCAETEGVVELSHLQLWATVLGSTTIEFEEGTDDVLTLDVHRVEFLPELP